MQWIIIDLRVGTGGWESQLEMPEAQSICMKTKSSTGTWILTMSLQLMIYEPLAQTLHICSKNLYLVLPCAHIDLQSYGCHIFLLAQN